MELTDSRRSIEKLIRFVRFDDAFTSILSIERKMKRLRFSSSIHPLFIPINSYILQRVVLAARNFIN